ncbi:hypothetical protein [Acidisoma sp. S159]|uniref:hypothetical protein n=1 Tax=Acidisoma sp. S159 TaxID=1747225 RepID=UPI00131EA83B|nr:hypothetical protein [Acidisoma sp. S159]
MRVVGPAERLLREVAKSCRVLDRARRRVAGGIVAAILELDPNEAEFCVQPEGGVGFAVRANYLQG